MSGLFTGNSKKLDQQIAQKIKEATSLLEELKKAILLFPTYNAGFFNMIEDLKKQTSYFEQYKQQDSSRFTTTAKQQLLQQLQENINSINKTIKDVKKKADVERGQQAIQSESEWVQEVIALNESPDDKHNKTVDDHIKQLTELQPHEEQLFFKHYSVIANFLEKKLKKSGAEKVLTQKKELLIQNLLSIPKEQKNNQFNAYIQYLKALQQEANRIINTEADAIRVIRELEKQLKQINPTLLNTYQETLKNQLKQLMISKKPEAQINVEQEKLMDDYEQKLKSAIQKMQPQQASTTKSNTNSTTKIQQALIQQIEDLDANMLSSLENNKTINKDDYDTLLNLISTLENNCEDVTPIMQSLKKLAYQGKIPTWTQQTHDMPSLEKLTNNDIDYLFSYASELVTQLNPEQQEVILIDIKYQLEDQLRKINPDLLAAYQKGLAEGLKVLSEDKKHDTKIGDKAVDLILGYTEILRKVINEQRLERLKILDDQLVQDLINLRLFIRTLPTYDFFRAQNIYKLITKQLHAISDKDMTAEEQLNKKKELIKSIASVTKAYQQHNTQHTTDQSYFSPSTDFNKPLEKLSELPISEFKSHFKNIVYKLEETLERFGKEASALLAEHKQRLFTKLLSADTESEKQILIDYLITLRTEILKLIENEPLGKSQETLPNSLPGAQSQQDLSTRNTGLDSSSMSMNTTPTSPIAPSSARSSRSAELTATPQPISDSSIKHASKSPLASTLFTTIQAPKLFEPEETKLEQQTASTLKNLLSDSDTAKSHYHEKAPPIPQIRTSSTPSKTVRPLSPVTRTTKEEKQQANNLQKTGLKLFQEREIEREEKERTTKMQAQLKQQSEQMQAQLTKSKQALETHEKEVREQISQHYQEIAQILYSTLQQDLTKQQQSNHTNQQKVLEQEAISSKITEQESMVTELKKLNIVAIKLKEIAAQRTLMFEKNEQKVTHLFEESKKALEAQKAKELEQQIKLLAQQLSEGQRQLEKDENEDRNIILEYAKKLKIIAEQLTQTTQKETQLRNALEQEILSEQKQLHYTRNASIAQIQANLLAQQALIQQAEEEKKLTEEQEQTEKANIIAERQKIMAHLEPQKQIPALENARTQQSIVRVNTPTKEIVTKIRSNNPQRLLDAIKLEWRNKQKKLEQQTRLVESLKQTAETGGNKIEIYNAEQKLKQLDEQLSMLDRKLQLAATEAKRTQHAPHKESDFFPRSIRKAPPVLQLEANKKHKPT